MTLWTLSSDIHTLGHKSKSVGIDQLLIAGAHLPAIINQRGEFPI
jgi:hypothetical protein